MTGTDSCGFAKGAAVIGLEPIKSQSDSSHARMSGLRGPVASSASGEVTSHAASAFAFIAKSISMYRLVV